MGRLYTRPRVELAASTREVNATINHLAMNTVGLGSSAFGVDMNLLNSEGKLFMQTFPVRGAGQATVNGRACPLDVAHGIVASPGENISVMLDADYAAILLVLKPQTLTAKLAALTGRPVNRPLLFHSPQDYSRPAASALRNHLFSVVEMLSAASAPLSQSLLAGLEETLAVAFLRANRHTYSDLLEDEAPRVAPWQVRRVEDFVAASGDKPITLEKLAEVAGVSALSLFRSVKKSRGCSPRQFIERLRGA